LGGNGGEGGDPGPTPDELRLAKWEQICGFTVDPALVELPGEPGPCSGGVTTCANAYLADTVGFDASCNATLDDLQDCLIEAAGSDLYCSEASEEDSLAGIVALDFSSCADLGAFNLCRQ
jgi:hypothetical protein